MRTWWLERSPSPISGSPRRLPRVTTAPRTILSRAYNVIEQMALRVAKAFENNVDDERGWHTELIRRLSIRIAGVRPALFPEEVRPPLQELRAFRHVFVHAYDLTIDPEKLALILKYGRAVAGPLPGFVAKFVASVAEEQGIEPPRRS